MLINKLDAAAISTMKTRITTSFTLLVYGILVICFAVLSSAAKFEWLDYSDDVRLAMLSVLIMLLSLAGILACWEINKLIFGKNLISFFVITFNFLIFSITPMVPQIIRAYHVENIERVYFLTTMTFLGSALFCIVTLIPLIFIYNKKQLKEVFILFFLQFVISIFFFGMYYLIVEKSWTTFLFICLIPMFADTYAYFGGSLFGKHKMAKTISPKKTWEGVVISVVLTTITTCLIAYGYELSNSHTMFDSLISNFFTRPIRWTIIVFTSVILSIVSIGGDLLFSFIKRIFKIKDYSNIFPGHGGVLDRVDSISVVIVIYSFIIFIISALTFTYNAY